LRDSKQISNPINISKPYIHFNNAFDHFISSYRKPRVDFFDISGSIILHDHESWIPGVFWIQYSNRIIYFTEGHGKVIVNIQNFTKRYIEIDFYVHPHIELLEIDGDRFIIIKKNSILIYDVHTINRVGKIKYDWMLIGYLKRFDLLVSSDFEYYCITQNLELKQIRRIGHNYLDDRKHIIDIIKTLMDSILCNDLLSQIPLEILCIELYMEISKYMD